MLVGLYPGVKTLKKQIPEGLVCLHSEDSKKSLFVNLPLLLTFLICPYPGGITGHCVRTQPCASVALRDLGLGSSAPSEGQLSSIQAPLLLIPFPWELGQHLLSRRQKELVMRIWSSEELCGVCSNNLNSNRSVSSSLKSSKLWPQNTAQ